jgi:Icc protein
MTSNLSKNFPHLNTDESLKHIERYLPQALQSREQVILLTHVPPFQASCQYGGAPCDNDRLPFYTNSALGEFLINIMKNAKNNRLLVLSGHTHVKTEYRPLRNLLVITGKAEYGSPQVQRIFRL